MTTPADEFAALNRLGEARAAAEQLREAIGGDVARLLYRHSGVDEDQLLNIGREFSDALLDGPLRPLLEAQAAVDRVRALADEYDGNINWREWGIGHRLRTTLDGAS